MRAAEAKAKASKAAAADANAVLAATIAEHAATAASLESEVEQRRLNREAAAQAAENYEMAKAKADAIKADLEPAEAHFAAQMAARPHV